MQRAAHPSRASTPSWRGREPVPVFIAISKSGTVGNLVVNMDGIKVMLNINKKKLKQNVYDKSWNT